MSVRDIADHPGAVANAATRVTRQVLTVIVVVTILAFLYLLQITIARGFQGFVQSAQLFARSSFEWLAWAILMPGVLWLADSFPVGPGRPRRNWAILLVGGALVMPLWAMLVAGPMSLLGLPRWGWRDPTGFVETARTAILQRGGYLTIVYGMIVAFGTARRLAAERQAETIRTQELQRELAEADLSAFTAMMGSDRLVERLWSVEVAMERSVDEAEAQTLALADDLHHALVKSRDILSGR